MKTNYEQIVLLYQDGMTTEQIAKKLGLDLSLVQLAIDIYNNGEANE